MKKNKADFWLTKDGLDMLKLWVSEGYTNKEIAEKMGIGNRTLMTYKKLYPTIKNAFEKNCCELNAKVEKALHQKAIGGITTVKRPIKLKRIDYEDGKKVKEEEIIEYATYDEYTSPDYKAGVFWLKNRMSERWKEQPESDNDEDNGILEDVISFFKEEDE